MGTLWEKGLNLNSEPPLGWSHEEHQTQTVGKHHDKSLYFTEKKPQNIISISILVCNKFEWKLDAKHHVLQFFSFYICRFSYILRK